MKVLKEKCRRLGFVLWLIVSTLATVSIVALLLNIQERKDEAKSDYVRTVEITEDTVDPSIWGENWPHEYQSFMKTIEPSKTRFGGGDTLPQEKSERDPWLSRMYAGYAFAIDYRDRHGHAYMLQDQEHSKRVTEKQQPGACLHCHSSIIPTYRKVGLSLGANSDQAISRGFEEVCAMKYQDARKLKDKSGQKLVTHPLSCLDCHDPKTMSLRVTRPAFITGIQELKAFQGIQNYNPNTMASHQEMRTYVCAQCHVEYYFKGDRKTLTYPWAKGTKVEEIEFYYDSQRFSDWKHAETSASMLKAQHPEFETWSQGIHAKSGVSCTDCHMPYTREGAVKITDHWVRSPLLNVNRACQQCHRESESEIKSRVETIQSRHHELLQRTSRSLVSFLDSVKSIRGSRDEEAWGKMISKDSNLQDALALHRKGQWRFDFASSENSMGFHAPQESARILAEAIDYLRQAEISVRKSRASRKQK